MDANSDLMMVDTDDENPQNYAQGALEASESAFVANNASDQVTLYLLLQNRAIINSLTFSTRYVDYFRLSIYESGKLSEELVRVRLQIHFITFIHRIKLQLLFCIIWFPSAEGEWCIYAFRRWSR